MFCYNHNRVLGRMVEKVSKDFLLPFCYTKGERDGMIKIFTLPANEGDFIWICYGENEMYNHILIDGGPKECGEEYASIINIIDERKEKIEALVLTHVDYDHIQGAIEGICRSSNDLLNRTVKKIYFNTCQGVRRNLKEVCKFPENSNFAEDQIRVNPDYKKYSVRDGIKFLDLLSEKGLEDRLVDYVVYGEQTTLHNNAIIQFISPGKKELIKFANQWEKYEKENEYIQYVSTLDMVKKNLSDLMNENLASDPSINNASSIAFIFEYQSIKLAFLGDARPSVCLQGIKKINNADYLEVDLLKLSHHGSRSNTSDSLLKTIRTNNYLLSTNGYRKKVPHKVVLSHLLKNSGEEKINLYCNYDWYNTEYHERYFTLKDYKEFLDTKKLSLYLLDDQALEIKDGCYIYGEYGMF